MSNLDPISEVVERIARETVDAAFRVHTTLGPGLLESVYETCLKHELSKRELALRQQIAMPVIYDGLRLDSGLRLDLIVGGELIVEVKAVEKLLPVHEAQMLTYLKLAGKRLGLLINFNVVRIKGRPHQRRNKALRALINTLCPSLCLRAFVVQTFSSGAGTR